MLLQLFEFMIFQQRLPILAYDYHRTLGCPEVSTQATFFNIPIIYCATMPTDAVLVRKLFNIEQEERL